MGDSTSFFTFYVFDFFFNETRNAKKELEGCIVWNDTIQHSLFTQSGPLSVHKLFSSCIRRCLVSRACD